MPFSSAKQTKTYFSHATDCATVGLCSIESANIVGYTETALQAGFKATGASFVSVGKDGCNLTSIKPAGFDRIAGTLNIQTLNNAGQALKIYKYYKGGRAPYATEGWYDGTTLITSDNDVSFPVGQGFWVAGAAGYKLTFNYPAE